MDPQYNPQCSAFQNSRCIAKGNLEEVVRQVKSMMDAGNQLPIQIFDDVTSDFVDLDFRGTVDDVMARAAPLSDKGVVPTETPDQDADVRRGPGRPKLGVIAREVTLLPRHWEWLCSQPGGASVTLRKLVEQARRDNRVQDKIRRSKEATYRFISTVAGDLPGYEEATRSLFAGDRARFEQYSATWSADIREYAGRLSQDAFMPQPVA